MLRLKSVVRLAGLLFRGHLNLDSAPCRFDRRGLENRFGYFGRSNSTVRVRENKGGWLAGNRIRWAT